MRTKRSKTLSIFKTFQSINVRWEQKEVNQCLESLTDFQYGSDRLDIHGSDQEKEYGSNDTSLMLWKHV